MHEIKNNKIKYKLLIGKDCYSIKYNRILYFKNQETKIDIPYNLNEASKPNENEEILKVML